MTAVVFSPIDVNRVCSLELGFRENHLSRARSCTRFRSSNRSLDLSLPFQVVLGSDQRTVLIPGGWSHVEIRQVKRSDRLKYCRREFTGLDFRRAPYEVRTPPHGIQRRSTPMCSPGRMSPQEPPNRWFAFRRPFQQRRRQGADMGNPAHLFALFATLNHS